MDTVVLVGLALLLLVAAAATRRPTPPQVVIVQLEPESTPASSARGFGLLVLVIAAFAAVVALTG